jgi:hypothetical protein
MNWEFICQKTTFFSTYEALDCGTRYGFCISSCTAIQRHDGLLMCALRLQNTVVVAGPLGRAQLSVSRSRPASLPAILPAKLPRYTTQISSETNFTDCLSARVTRVGSLSQNYTELRVYISGWERQPGLAKTGAFTVCCANRINFVAFSLHVKYTD